jgi:hypothetical protein
MFTYDDSNADSLSSIVLAGRYLIKMCCRELFALLRFVRSEHSPHLTGGICMPRRGHHRISETARSDATAVYIWGVYGAARMLVN